MEAALWGRLETVIYLTGNGADVQVHDANGMDALELAANSERNTGERVSRASSIYREHPNANHQRVGIEHHLKSLSNHFQMHSPNPSERGLSYFQRTADGNFALHRPHSLLIVPDGYPEKAFAELDRGKKLPIDNSDEWLYLLCLAGRPRQRFVGAQSRRITQISWIVQGYFLRFTCRASAAHLSSLPPLPCPVYRQSRKTCARGASGSVRKSTAVYTHLNHYS